MAEVHPFTNFEDIRSIRRVLTNWENIREAEGFWLGCHVGLRIGDLLSLKFSDFKGDRVVVQEGKTGKKRDFPISQNVRESVEIIRTWYKQQGLEPEYVFQATGNRVGDQSKPVSTSYFYRKLSEAIEALALPGNYGSHSMRKSFGYHLYKKCGDIALIQKILNHHSPSETLNYIGVTKVTIDEAYMNLDFTL